jgi:hypothetical protein
VQPSVRPERNITILFVSTAIIFVLVGSVLGTLWMLYLSSSSISNTVVLFHPYFQMFGFLAMFVIGVEYSLLPRFAGVKLEKKYLAYISYMMIISFLILSILSTYYLISGIYPSILLFGASSIFMYQTLSITKKIRLAFVEANPFFNISAFSFFLFASLLLVSSLLSLTFNIFSPKLFQIFLLGFIGSIVFGVEIRSVAFRQSNYKKKLTTAAWITQLLAITLIVAGLFFQALILLADVFFFASSLLVIFAIEFKLIFSQKDRPLMTDVHLKIKRYNEVCLSFSFFWLIIGILSSIFVELTGNYFFRDMMIHTLAMGFTGSAIVCFAPMFLPAIVNARGPTTGLSYGPIVTLVIAVATRIACDFEAISVNNFPWWGWYSGLLVLASVAWLILMLVRITKIRK